MNSSRDLHSEPIQSALWRAGAGAGKTYNLVARVLRIAEEWQAKNDGALPRLVVTTFTRMATQELRVRLMQAILEKSNLHGAVAKVDPKLVQFVTSRSQLFVTTMHGVMESYLRNFAREAGLDAGFRMAQADEKRNLIRRVAQPILQNAPEAIIANFGFRRAADVLHRVAQIRCERPDLRAPDLSVLSLLWRQEFASALGDLRTLKSDVESAGNPKWDTFLEWLNVLILELSSISMTSNRFGTDDVDRIVAILNGQPEVDNRTKPKVEFSSGKNWKSVFLRLSEMCELIADEIKAFSISESLHQSILQLSEDFERALTLEKRTTGLIELEDLEILSLKLLREHPETATTFSESFDHWLIDEYQDTSPRQVRLLEALSSKKGTFVVGDPQQSIYLFRGARPSVFQERESMAHSNSHARESLTLNRRSSALVMDVINSAVRDLGSAFHPMQAHRTAPGVQSPFGVAHYLSISAQEKERASERRRREAGFVAQAISRLIEARIRPETIVVLARKNAEILDVASELDRLNVPNQIFTSGSFSDRQEITDLACLLSFIVNPHDDFNLIHLARSPWFPISEDTLALGYKRTKSLWSVIETRVNDGEVEALRNIIEVARERGVVEAFKAALLSCDFFSFCGALDPSGRREANAHKFLTRLSTAERQAGFNPRRFVDEILEVGDDKGSDRDAVAAKKPDRVSLMTIHASKGLEFDHVFIPFTASGRKAKTIRSDVVLHEELGVFGLSMRDADDGASRSGVLGRSWAARLHEWESEEDRRLLYVALTRAKESLFLSSLGEAAKGSFAEMLAPTLHTSLFQRSSDLDFKDVGTLKDAETNSKPLSRTTVTIRPPISMTEVGQKLNHTVLSLSVTKLLELEESRHSVKSSRGELKRAVQGDAHTLEAARLAADGTRLHRVFELAKMLSTGQPTAVKRDERGDKLGDEIARWFETESDRKRAMTALNWLLKMKSPDIASILATGEAEWSFVYLSKIAGLDPSSPELMIPCSVEGQIDLWGRDSKGALWVIDYKTGSDAYSEKALRQLKYYADALRAGGVAKESEAIFAAAVYPFSESVFLREF